MSSQTRHIDPIICLTWITALLTTGCHVTKYVPEGDQLYKGIHWKVDSARIDKQIMSEMEDLPRPKPNSRILGVPLKLLLYNLLPQPKKSKGLLFKLKTQWSEAPVLYSQVSEKAIRARVENELFHYGYFRPHVAMEKMTKGNEASLKILISPGTRYRINDIVLPQDTSGVARHIKESIQLSLLKKGSYINTGTLEDERERIDDRLKNRGYFYFSPDYILYRVDSLHAGSADVYYTIKNETPAMAQQTWRIGKISVYGNYSLKRDSIITRQKGKKEKRFTLVDNRERYHADVYERALLIKENQLYRENLHSLSIERLMNLNTFKFVKFQFIPDTAFNRRSLDTRIFITPMKKNTLRLEATANTKTGNFVGSEFSLKLRNINLLKGAEILDLKITTGFDIQVGGTETQSANAQTLQGELSFSIPRIIPGFKVRTGINSFIPRTGITLGGEYLRRPDLYTQRSLRMSLEYVWKQKRTIEHTVRPIRIQMIDPSNITPKFDSILAEDIALRASFEKQLILGSNYQFLFNNTFNQNKRFTQSLRLIAGSSGNLFNLIANSKVDTPGAVKLFNVPVSQFLRFEADLRGYLNMGKKLVWANRAIFGIANAYGNSRIAPYSEQFFIGGSSSIRAFRIRTLGPGSYHTDEKVYQANESGEIKVELNTEMRYSLGKYFRFAGFVDAGNIWLSQDVPDKPGAGLNRGDLFAEMAVGAGIGLRLDFSILLLRFDWATPLRKPWYPEGSRWVFNEINLGNKAWRKDNMILNIGIGYPF